MTTNIIIAVITGYCACHKCCGLYAKGITASGSRPIQGVTIAARRSFPFGSKVEIEGHTYVVQDRLARCYDERFDIYFKRHGDAKKFGIKTNKVNVITR